MRKLFVLVASVALLNAGCGGASKSPTAPSSSQGSTATGSPTSPTTPASATIGGTVQKNGAAAKGMTIAVMNTSMSTQSDDSGHFNLANVPAGDVQLHVTGQGADAVVAVGTVQPSQNLQIVVNVSGNSGTVEPPENEPEPENEVNGAVEALPPTVPAGDFRVNGQLVHTDASTQFRDGTFASLKVGTKVEAKGTMSGTTLNATSVEVLAANAPAPNPPAEPEPETELKGVVSGLSGTASSFTFKVGSTTVKGDSSTKFEGSSDGGSSASAGFSSLKNGVTVEVHGTTSGTTVTATSINVEDANDDNGNDGNDNEGNEVELKGSLTTVTGSCPSISSSISGTKFTTSSSTRFDVSCSSLASGMSVEVKGTKQSNGTVAATRVQKED